ncbi:MAG: hypothetical protein N5P05_001414 [Chroococcopsis gigantea SAG 12.99]|jgi:chitin synthase|nr:hypothetical protein [Chroococcopsis gigantea SAG 12.99]
MTDKNNPRHYNLSKTADPNHRDYEPGQITVSEEERPKILICLTMYNEEGTDLLCSLAGIKHNLDYLVMKGKSFLAERINLCLIIDGREKISPSAAELLEALGLYQPSRLAVGAQMQIFDSRLNVELLEKYLYHETINRQTNDSRLDVYRTALQEYELPSLPPEQIISPPVLVCIKEANAGKIDSHWWFFQVFCSQLQPDYCVQMDVGCVPKPNSIHDVWQFLEKHSDVGAATGDHLLPAPRKPWDIVALRQFGDSYVEKLLSRPAEFVAGYLSVLPGRFSVFRWATLKADDQSKSPLNRYFQGMDQQPTLFEANTFLVEDMVICPEIVTGTSPSWRLAYLPSLETISDSCHSLSELLHQRRRWTNGCFACYVSFLTRLPDYLSRENLGIARKMGLLTSAPLYIVRSLRDWFMLALIPLIYISIYQGLKYLITAHSSSSTGVLDLAFIGEILLLASPLLLYQFCKQSQVLFFTIVIYSALFIVMALVISTYLGYYLPLLISVFFILIISIIAKIRLHEISGKLWIYLPLYFLLTRISFSFLLKNYAFLNIGDRSWGTKGLTGNQSQERRSNYYISLWILSNLVLIIVVVNFHLYGLVFILAVCDWLIGLIGGIVIASTELLNGKRSAIGQRFTSDVST